MDHHAGSRQEPTPHDLYGVVLHHEHRLLRDAAGVEDLLRWRDRLVAELTRAESTYARVMSSASGTVMPADGALPYAVFLDRWARIVGETIHRLQRLGVVASQQTPEDLATAILAAVQGGVLLARVTDDVRALQNALRLPFEQLVLYRSEHGSD